MKIYTDESGDFSLNNGKISLIGSILLTDRFYKSLPYTLGKLERSFLNGKSEPKGANLDISQRMQLCQFVKKYKTEIKIVISLVGPKYISLDELIKFRNYQAQTFQRNKDEYIARGGKAQDIIDHMDRVTKIVQYSTRLSNEEFLQAFALVHQLRKSFQCCLAYFMSRRFKESFRNFEFVIDRKLPSKLSSMEKYVTGNIMPFLDAHSRKEPLLVVDLWKSDHPFEKKYINSDGHINLRKVFEHGIILHDSRHDIGLRLVDYICNTFYAYHNGGSSRDMKYCIDTLMSAMTFEFGKPYTALAFEFGN